MQAIELLRSALTMTQEGLMALIEGIRHAPMTQPTSKGGNHPLWSLGHMCAVEGAIQASIAGEPNRYEHLWKLFGPGTEPSTDASRYPSFDELARTFRTIRADTLKLLDRVGEAGLDKPPSVIPPGFEEPMRTVGHTFLLISLHQMVHYGQIAVARHAAGLKPLM